MQKPNFSVNRSSATVALISGLEFEANIARDLVKNTSCETPVLVAGPGAPYAKSVVTEAIRKGAEGIISFGVCGGLDPALSPGAVMLPETILAPQEIPVDQEWRTRLQQLLKNDFDISSKPLLTVDKTVGTVQEKADLFRQTGACAVDMESGVLAREAAKLGLVFIAVRVVHDPALQAIPAIFTDIIRKNGQIDPWKLVKGLMFNWPGFAELKKMSDNDAQARANLEGLTRLALPGFGRIDRNLNS